MTFESFPGCRVQYVLPRHLTSDSIPNDSDYSAVLKTRIAAMRREMNELERQLRQIHNENQHLYQQLILLQSLVSSTQQENDSLHQQVATLQQQNQQLQELAMRDPLTGLFNRRYLDDTLCHELSRANRHRYPVGLIMLDIDYFREFNTRYGHAGGDVLLRAVGQLVQKQTDEDTIACRYGGEEFTIILPESSLDETYQQARTIQASLRTLHVAYEQQPLAPVTASLGVACYPDHGTTPETLLRAADRALYRAKGEGRNRVVLADL